MPQEKQSRLPIPLEHSEFISKLDQKAIIWGVHGFLKPVYLVQGSVGILWVLVCFSLALTPTVLLGCWGAVNGQWGRAAWAVLGVLAFLTGRSNVNCIAGLPWAVATLAGSVLSLFFGPHHLVGGALTAVNWFLSGATKGMPLVTLEHQLRASPELFYRLRDQRLLIVARVPGMGEPLPQADSASQR